MKALIHITRDGGGAWEEITPNDMPDWGLVSIIEESTHEPGVAFSEPRRPGQPFKRLPRVKRFLESMQPEERCPKPADRCDTTRPSLSQPTLMICSARRSTVR